MGWIRWTGKVLEFSGKLVQSSTFEDWAEKQGAALIEKVAIDSGLKLFKTSRAKDAIWEELASQFKKSDTFLATVQGAVAGYPLRISAGIGGWSTRLPSETASNVVVVPRFLVDSWEVEFWRSFDSSQELATLKGGPALREYFFQEMVRQLAEAFSAAAAKASPKNPIQIGDRWLVGFDPQYAWGNTEGHYYVYSSFSARAGASKDDKKDARQRAERQMETCKRWLGSLSGEKRAELLKRLVSYRH